MPTNYSNILNEKFPFLSILTYGNDCLEYIGIVQNTDTLITSIYDYAELKTDEEKKQFLALGEKWYYESNRLIPINIYLKDEWKPFDKTFKTFITKEITVIHGMTVSINNIINKKKRRSIIMVKKTT